MSLAQLFDGVFLLPYCSPLLFPSLCPFLHLTLPLPLHCSRGPTPRSDGTIPPASPCIWSAAEAEEGSQAHVVRLSPHLVPTLPNIPVIHHHLAAKRPGKCLTKC